MDHLGCSSVNSRSNSGLDSGSGSGSSSNNEGIQNKANGKKRPFQQSKDDDTWTVSTGARKRSVLNTKESATPIVIRHKQVADKEKASGSVNFGLFTFNRYNQFIMKNDAKSRLGMYRQSSILKAPSLKYLEFPWSNISVIVSQNCTSHNKWSPYELNLLSNTFRTGRWIIRKWKILLNSNLENLTV